MQRQVKVDTAVADSPPQPASLANGAATLAGTDPAVAATDPALAGTELALRDRRRGVALIALGALAFAAMGAMAKAASADVPTFELVAARSAVTWAVMELLRRRLGLPLRFGMVPVLAVRTLAGFAAIAMYFHALRFIPLGEAVLLNNTSPVLTSLAAVALLGERMTAVKAAALGGALLGLWLLLGARDLSTLAGQGAWLGAGSAVAGAIAMVALKKASAANRALMIVWALAAVSTLGSLLLADRSWLVPTPREGWLLLGTGVAAAIAQLLMTSGYRRLEASEASVYSFLTPLFSLLTGMALFGEQPGWRAATGGLLILGAGSFSAWRTMSRVRQSPCA